jgi:hypothetical protein
MLREFGFFKTEREWTTKIGRTALAHPSALAENPEDISIHMNSMKLRNWLSHRRAPRLEWLIFATLLVLSWSVYHFSHGAQWSEQIGFATLFSVLIWMKDDSPTGRWVMIGIIAVGTVVSILLAS